MEEYHSEPYYKLTPLPSIKWPSWKICPDNQESYSIKPKKRDKIYTNVWWHTEIHPCQITLQSLMQIPLQQSHQIYFTIIKCSQMTNGSTQWTSQSESEESTSSNTWPMHLDQTVMYQDTTTRKMVPSEDNKTVWWT